VYVREFRDTYVQSSTLRQEVLSGDERDLIPDVECIAKCELIAESSQIARDAVMTCPVVSRRRNRPPSRHSESGVEAARVSTEPV